MNDLRRLISELKQEAQKAGIKYDRTFQIILHQASMLEKRMTGQKPQTKLDENLLREINEMKKKLELAKQELKSRKPLDAQKAKLRITQLGELSALGLKTQLEREERTARDAHKILRQKKDEENAKKASAERKKIENRLKLLERDFSRLSKRSMQIQSDIHQQAIKKVTRKTLADAELRASSLKNRDDRKTKRKKGRRK